MNLKCLSNKDYYIERNLLFLLAGGDKQLYEYIIRYPEGGPRAHRCTMCGKVGNDRGNLRKHVESLHFPGSFVYTCKHCSEDFDTKTKLNNHVMRVCKKANM